MASEVKDAKHVKDVQVKEEPMPEQEVFGFNDPRYADLQLRLMIAPQSPSLPLPLPLPVVVDRLIDNDSSSATMSVKNSEGRGNVLYRKHLYLVLPFLTLARAPSLNRLFGS